MASATWTMIHAERASLCDVLDGLTADQWSDRSLCEGWTVQVVTGHVLKAAEMTPLSFFQGLGRAGMRFNTMTDRDARQLGREEPSSLVSRLRARTTTTNHPPGPPNAMLGEIVVHGQDICRPLGIEHSSRPEALIACLEMYRKANFPVGTKRRIAGLRLRATDLEWSTGTGPEVTGAASALLMAMTGRSDAIKDLSGEGVAVLAERSS